MEPHAVTVLTGVGGIETAVSLLAEIRSRAPGVRAAEYFEAAGLALVRAHTGLPAPLARARIDPNGADASPYQHPRYVSSCAGFA